MPKLLPGGFGELTPTQQIIENKIKELIKKNYELYGFVNIETPSVELSKVLTAKGGGEVAKQIFGLYGLKQGGEDLKDYSLHFDLTVPFARYVVDNEENIKFPFKRYQIQKVWRGERQQKGRFKEFTQCDIDVIGPNLSLEYDSEIIGALYKSLSDIFDFLKLQLKAEVHLNNKQFLEGICEKYKFSNEEKIEFLKILDDFYKLEKVEFETKLKQVCKENFAQINILLNTSIENLDENIDELSIGIKELKNVYFNLKKSGVNVVFDPYITRGLDYYTGSIFETFIENNFDFGSVCSGGRYDNLVGEIKKIANNGKEGNIKYLGVGGSIGLSRLFSRLKDADFINLTLPLSDVIILNAIGGNAEFNITLANSLRQNNIKTDIYFQEDKLQKQFIYAESKNITFAIIAGGDEIEKNEVVVKNLILRTQENIKIPNLISYLKENLG